LEVNGNINLIDDTAYGTSWDSDTIHAPTKNSIYDVLSSHFNQQSGGHAQPYVYVKKNSNQTLTHNAWTPIQFTSSDTEVYDALGFHDPTTDNTRFTIPSGYAGIYIVSGVITYGTANNDGGRGAVIKVNGTDYHNITIIATGYWQRVSVCDILYLDEGDYVEFLGIQTSGVDIITAYGGSTITEFKMVRIAPSIAQ